jgi:hypothetical protein
MLCLRLRFQCVRQLLEEDYAVREKSACLMLRNVDDDGDYLRHSFSRLKHQFMLVDK